MKNEFLEKLRDPENFEPLFLKANAQDLSGACLEGELFSKAGKSYPILRGIPRFVSTKNQDQIQTSEAFGYKWKKREAYDSEAMKRESLRWYLEKYGYPDLQTWAADLSRHGCILDLGCGSGFSASLWLGASGWNTQTQYLGIDISEAVDVARERLGHHSQASWIQADLMSVPLAPQSVDFIFSEGVLHHTPSTREALLAAAALLKKGGEFHFYVYRKKGPIREYVDDYIRDQIQNLSLDEAWEEMRKLTRLGKNLVELQATVRVEDDLPLLGIQKGEFDLQRWIYWNFAKLYWNKNLSLEENVHVNFDWYRPKFAHRQTAQEVRQWCQEAGLSIQWFHEQESGLTLRTVKV